MSDRLLDVAVYPSVVFGVRWSCSSPFCFCPARWVLSYGMTPYRRIGWLGGVFSNARPVFRHCGMPVLLTLWSALMVCFGMPAPDQLGFFLHIWFRVGAAGFDG